MTAQRRRAAGPGEAVRVPVPAGDQLLVSEVFGPTFQGEGASAGQRCGFVRLGRCNLSCRWCDTPYTWDWARHDPAVELAPMSPAQILDQLEAMRVDRVVVTGGEPLVQQRRLLPLAEAMRARGWGIEVETNGTVIPDARLTDQVDRFNVSPKLANSGETPARRVIPDALHALASSGRAVFKFVVADPDDLAEVGELVDRFGLAPVWVMPEGTTEEAVLAGLRRLAGPVLDRGWHLSTRLHILVWGDERGR